MGGVSVNAEYCIVMTTFSDDEVGKKIIAGLIEQRLAACVQEFYVRSHYRWKGDVHHEGETLLFIKTKAALYAKVEAFIKENHSYEVPEIIQVPITTGLPAYLKWMDDECA